MEDAGTYIYIHTYQQNEASLNEIRHGADPKSRFPPSEIPSRDPLCWVEKLEYLPGSDPNVKSLLLSSPGHTQGSQFQARLVKNKEVR